MEVFLMKIGEVLTFVFETKKGLITESFFISDRLILQLIVNQRE